MFTNGNKWNNVTSKSPLKIKKDEDNKVFFKVLKKYEK